MKDTETHYWAQELKSGDRFKLNGRVYTVVSVRYISGYHGKYAILTEQGTVTLYGGEQVEKA